MLKQILKDMFVDPEILAGLDETQKQTLFCKMREEQIRRWRLWDQESNVSASPSIRLSSQNREKIKKRQVTFLKDENDEPWVWVMGEHPTDKTIDEIIAEEAQEKAREMAVIETKELRLTMEAEFSEIISEQKKKIDDEEDEMCTPKIDELEIYCSVDELRERMNQSRTPPAQINKNIQNIYGPRLTNFNITNSIDKRDILQEISLNKPTQRVSAKIALWEKRVIGERTNEIFKRIQKIQQESAREAEEAAKKQEEFWMEQERKAKEADLQIREIARRAREEHRKSALMEEKSDSSYSSNTSQPTSLDLTVPRPPNREAVLKWYHEEERLRGAGIENGKSSTWFHGFLTRAEAEQRLLNEICGTFLVRVTEKIWGYAISYKDIDKCKHYLVDASNSHYQFLGANQMSHIKLADLINYHSNVPITLAGNELLQRSCPLNPENSNNEQNLS